MIVSVGTARRATAHSLIELLVVIGIIGILIGLTLPAMQSAREAARSTQCSNNLGQIMRAVHSFEADSGGFPQACLFNEDIRDPKREDWGYFSLQCTLLPYVEQRALYDSINFDLPATTPFEVEAFHKTVATRRIGVYLCPSDPYPISGAFATNSYRACTGLGETWRSPSWGALAAQSGAFSPSVIRTGLHSVIRLAEISDGLSNTLAFSEKPIGSGPGRPHSPFRDWTLFRGNELPPGADQWMLTCARLAPERSMPTLYSTFTAGGSWMVPGAIFTHFFASAPPNTRIPDCGTAGIDMGLGIFAARSYHPGGINAAMADGSVRRFTSGIDTNTWRALGTRAGGEVVSE